MNSSRSSTLQLHVKEPQRYTQQVGLLGQETVSLTDWLRMCALQGTTKEFVLSMHQQHSMSVSSMSDLDYSVLTLSTNNTNSSCH